MDFEQCKADVVAVMQDFRLKGLSEAHSFQIARAVTERRGDSLLVPHGILYGALRRLEDERTLTSRWEVDDEMLLADDRPRRRFYRLTGSTHRRGSFPHQ